MAYPLIVLGGPTGVGKTRIALAVAEKIGGEIISADSRQLYRGLDIGTAKPTLEQRKSIVHHMIDVIDPTMSFSAGAFARQAWSVIDRLQSHDTPVLLVGGSGMYVTATLDGLGDSPKTDQHFRRRLEAQIASEGLAGLHQALSDRAPEVAERIPSKYRVRIMRALELLKSTGRADLPTSRKNRVPVTVMVAVSRPRQLLHDQIAQRTTSMIHAGWLEEVQSLLESGVAAATPGMASLGYAGIVAHLRGRKTLDQTIADIVGQTRQYAKRQMTWLRRDRRYRWLDVARWGHQGVVNRIVESWSRRLVETC